MPFTTQYVREKSNTPLRASAMIWLDERTVVPETTPIVPFPSVRTGWSTPGTSIFWVQFSLSTQNWNSPGLSPRSAPASKVTTTATLTGIDTSVFGLLLDRVECTHHLDGLARDLRRGFLRVDNLPPQMGPASGAHDTVAGHHAVVAAVSVGKQNLVVVLKKILRPVTAAAQREVEDIVGMRRVAHVHPHARIHTFLLAQHGHDGVVAERPISTCL